jgi:hypothetical protein
MNLLNQFNVNNPARRNKSQDSPWPMRDADRANSSKVKPGGSRASELTFAEDFILKHSLPGTVRHITASEILGFF